jgi:hypothetical protein
MSSHNQLYHTIPEHNNSGSGNSSNDNTMTIPPRPQGISFRGEPNQQRWRRASAALPPALYDWRRHAPKSGWLSFLRWTIEGSTSFAEVSDDDRLANLRGLASCLRLLREYRRQFGLPPENSGTVHDQALVLREVTRDLYEGATPLWALEYVMQKAAEGLTGHRNVNWMLLPRKGFMCIPADLHSTTIMFDMRRGFILHKMERMERVAVRLASFASNTIGSSSSIQAKFPTRAELERARHVAVFGGGDGGGEDGTAIPRYDTAEEMAEGPFCLLFAIRVSIREPIVVSSHIRFVLNKTDNCVTINDHRHSRLGQRP